MEAVPLPIGSIVVPCCGFYLGSYKVVPKRNYYGADGYSSCPPRKERTHISRGCCTVLNGLPNPAASVKLLRCCLSCTQKVCCRMQNFRSRHSSPKTQSLTALSIKTLRPALSCVLSCCLNLFLYCEVECMSFGSIPRRSRVHGEACDYIILIMFVV